MCRQEVLEQLRSVFSILNRELFDGVLPAIVFVSGRRRGIFHFDYSKYRMIVGQGIADVTLSEALDDLLHQMCHVFNKMEGVKDQTDNEYHNKRFAKTALRVGLAVSKHRNKGCTTCITGSNGDTTLPLQEAKVKKELSFAMAGQILNLVDLKKVPKQGAKKRFFLKYECGCPPPHNSVRSGRRPDSTHKLNIVCQDCGQVFRCVD